ncbi:glycosyltransferase [Litchfieldia alkalitelluris]|uniref:glycosyltransferase n=1 Tax=Litchfieldia alkalitelluris TaxID=304268 RepID=UPI001F296EA0|nr:glycosyltransferase [Litchfieldia alkalitelluris]
MQKETTKKKIIFMLINMNIGGTEKALLNMISEIPTDEYDITILMLEEYGGFLNYIPKEGIKVLYVEGYEYIKDLYNNPPRKEAYKYLTECKIMESVGVIFFHFISKVIRDRSFFLKYVLRNIPILDNYYDAAIAYAGPMDLISYFVLNKIRAKKKAQWIHFDVTKIDLNKEFIYKMYRKFSKVFVVSNEGKDKFLSVLPSFENKVEVIRNIVSPNQIMKQAKSGKSFDDEFDGVRILTIGRLTSEKGQDLAVKALRKLIDNGYNVKWYCIGDGNSKGKYENLVKDNKLENQFVFLGAIPNPYGYLDKCDIYVQPSRHEGYCISIAEAKCLNKPIVTTDSIGAKEQIKNGINGLIVKAQEDEIYKGLVNLINDKKLCNYFKENLSREKIINYPEINKLLSYLN